MHFQIHKWVCYAIGYVFITSGIMKLVNHDFIGIFINLGIPFPEFTLYVIAMIEVACGMLIAAGMYIKHATPPLIIIMLGALFLTKLPILANGGFLTFAFEARLDIVMLILLVIVWKNLRLK
ncbi:DoxX family protein [Oceanobacillus bengalensis]|nr:DoxX family protein [Oceanobacillus bengalensis]